MLAVCPYFRDLAYWLACEKAKQTQEYLTFAGVASVLSLNTEAAAELRGLHLGLQLAITEIESRCLKLSQPSSSVEASEAVAKVVATDVTEGEAIIATTTLLTDYQKASLSGLRPSFPSSLPTIDWDSAPEWATCAAMDSDTSWNWYQDSEPSRSEFQWMFNPPKSKYEKFDFPPFQGRWQDSLQQRPTREGQP